LSASGKEELARKLRRVASAPNAQGLFSKGKKNNGDSRPTTADEDALAPPKPNGMGAHSNASAMSLGGSALIDDNSLTVPDLPGDMSPGKIRNNIAFRRTYSSNSIKVRNVEVGPSSFDKIKLIGKGDVGKVYLVREKKSSRLYAMKGERRMMIPTSEESTKEIQADPSMNSLVEEGNDQAKQDQARSGGTGNPGDQQPPIHCHTISLVPVRRPSLSMHGILQRRRVLPRSANSTQ
jgi:hypothetical protein